MKKLYSTFIAFLAATMTSNAQMKVSSTGTVTMGGTANSTNAQVTIKETESMSDCAGLRINGRGGNGFVKSSLEVFPAVTISASHSGITAWSSPSTDYCYGVGGCYYGSTTPANGGAGIYGSSTTFYNMTAGTYAGYFNGNVRVTGSLQGTLLTPSGTSSTSSSAAMLRETPMRAFSVNGSEDESVSDKLQQVQLLQLSRAPEANKFTPEEIQAQKEIIRKAMQSDDEDAKSAKIDDIKVPEQKPQTQLASIKYGLAADQLKTVYPELVYEDEYGNVSINYIEMVPLLVQAVNELKSELAQVKEKNAAAAKTRTDATAINTADETVLSLSQNNPNPFSVSTSIEVSVPESVKSANIFIYDMSGKQMKKLDVADRGTSRITVLGAGLNEGMYIYTLVADGKVAGTKKMILTK